MKLRILGSRLSRLLSIIPNTGFFPFAIIFVSLPSTHNHEIIYIDVWDLLILYLEGEAYFGLLFTQILNHCQKIAIEILWPAQERKGPQI